MSTISSGIEILSTQTNHGKFLRLYSTNKKPDLIMRKIKLLVVAVTAFVATNASAQVFEEGNVAVDLYYGFPNLYSTTFKGLYANSGSEQDVEINGLGPVGIRGEYLLTDKVGLGLDIGFNNTKLTFRDAGTDGQGNATMYDYTYSTQKIGVMVTFNYHFIENDDLDFYGIVGAGYGNRSFKFESTDPNYTDVDIKGVVPVASRLGVGLRYFFTDNVGANVALGFGQGGLINAGLSFKF
jgi:outer membrane protein W